MTLLCDIMVDLSWADMDPCDLLPHYLSHSWTSMDPHETLGTYLESVCRATYRGFKSRPLRLKHYI